MAFDYAVLGRKLKDARESLLITPQESASRLKIDLQEYLDNVPQSKRASDAELSCFVVAKRIGGRVLTDDRKAINYIQRYIQMPTGSVTQLVEILIEAYLENHLGDHELGGMFKVSSKSSRYNVNSYSLSSHFYGLPTHHHNRAWKA